MTHFAMLVTPYMSAPVVTVPERATLAFVEATLRERAISCVPVVDDDGRHKGVESRIGEVMTSPVFTMPAGAPLSLAIDRLENAHVAGVVVIDDDGWPVGMFTQTEGLDARGLPGETPVEEVMCCAMLCLDA